MKSTDLLSLVEGLLLTDLSTVLCVQCGMVGKRKEDDSLPHLWTDHGHGLIECPRCSERE